MNSNQTSQPTNLVLQQNSILSAMEVHLYIKSKKGYLNETIVKAYYGMT